MSAERATVSVIIPTYNAEAFLAECLESILAQTLQSFEIIIVDDGSTDGTLALAQQYAGRDERISCYAQPNSGAGTARNAGLAHATGEWLLFFDSDDFMKPEMLQTLVDAAESNDAEVAVCQSYSFVDTTGEVTVENDGFFGIEAPGVYGTAELGEFLFTNVLGWPWDKIFKASLIERCGLTFQEIKSSNDAYFVFCAMALAERVAFIRPMLVAHRKHSSSIEVTRHATPANARLSHEAIRERLSCEPVWPVFEQNFMKWDLLHLRWNYKTLEGDARIEARNDYLAALQRAKGRQNELDEGEDIAALEALERAEQTSLEGELVEQAVLAAQIEELKAANAWLDEELRKMTEHANNQKRRIAELDAHSIKLQNQVWSDEAVIKFKDDDIEALKSSTSYKLGVKMTAAPRLAKRVISKVKPQSSDK